MLATFCLRLALGLAAALLVVPAAEVAPRFYRIQFLVILGLLAGGMFFYWPVAGPALMVLLVSAMVLAFAGSVVWMLEGAPLGRALVVLTALVLAAATIVRAETGLAPGRLAASIADDWSSAALLGSATAAMLMGHTYLTAPGMSMTPLLRLLGALFVAVVVRMALAGLTLWTLADTAQPLSTDLLLWLPVRWLVGFLGPLVLGWMAWNCARIRSTQSATGILYVVVILCFIGELTGELLRAAQARQDVAQSSTISSTGSRPFSRTSVA
jgi:hypothetical protein